MSAETPDASLTMTVDRGVATLTLTRPQKSNAYDRAMQRGLGEYMRQAAEDPAIRVLVLRGAGRHFCAGADLGPSSTTNTNDAPGIAELCHRLESLPKPTLALVQGACLGGGMVLICCCDFVFATKDAFFSMPEARLGFSPTPLIPFVLQAVGAGNTRRMLMAGARFGADEALRLGLVQSVDEPARAEQALNGCIAELLMSAPGAIAEIKTTVARLKHRLVTDELLAELQRGFDAGRQSAEAREGRAAMHEKRPPNWTIKR